jgi:hypothetical protein
LESRCASFGGETPPIEPDTRVGCNYISDRFESSGDALARPPKSPHRLVAIDPE